MKVEILHCPLHEFYAIAIDAARVLGEKCCGRWEVKACWTINNPRDLLNAIKHRKRLKPAPAQLPPKGEE